MSWQLATFPCLANADSKSEALVLLDKPEM